LVDKNLKKQYSALLRSSHGRTGDIVWFGFDFPDWVKTLGSAINDCCEAWDKGLPRRLIREQIEKHLKCYSAILLMVGMIAGTSLGLILGRLITWR
jgi:hypothetical protein